MPYSVSYYHHSWREITSKIEVKTDEINWFEKALHNDFFSILNTYPHVSYDYFDLMSETFKDKINYYLSQSRFNKNSSCLCPNCNKNLNSQHTKQLIKKIYNLNKIGKIIFAVSVDLLQARDNLTCDKAVDFYQIRKAIKNKKIFRLESQNDIDSLKNKDFLICAVKDVDPSKELNDEIFEVDTNFGEYVIFFMTDEKLFELGNLYSQNYCNKCQNFFKKPLEYIKIGGNYFFIKENRLAIKDINDFKLVLKTIFELKPSQLQYIDDKFLSLCQKISDNFSQKTIQIVTEEENIAKLIIYFYPQKKFKFFIPAKINIDDKFKLSVKNLGSHSDYKKTFDQVISTYRDKASLLYSLGLDKILLKLIKSTLKYRSSLTKDKINLFSQDTLNIKLFTMTLKQILESKLDFLITNFNFDKEFTKRLEILASCGLSSLNLISKVNFLTPSECKRINFFSKLISKRSSKISLKFILKNEVIKDLGDLGIKNFIQTIARYKKANQSVFVWVTEHDMVTL